MKRFVVSMLVVAVVLGSAVAAIAKGPAGVSNTKHNLSSSAPYIDGFGESPYKSNEDEVCIFCHTPHGGALNGPLWNHVDPTSTFTHYNSATLSPYIKNLGVTRALGNESLICMSCHDGSVSVYALHNNSNDIGVLGAPASDASGFTDTDLRIVYIGGGGPNIGGGYKDLSEVEFSGGDLTDDHPISFSYDGLYSSAEYQATGAKYGKLRDSTYAEGHGVEFFGGTKRVECSSCHDPHVDSATNIAYAPFLVTSNAGSALCLACHIK